MAVYKNFQSDNFKHDWDRYNIYNPEFETPVKPNSDEVLDNFYRNLDKWIKFVSWARFYPDLFYDLITPKKGGIRLDLDQRVFLRALSRFISVYGVFPRGYGKCVSGDTLIYTTKGLKFIGDCFGNIDNGKELYFIQNISLIDGSGNIARSYKGIYSGYLPTKKIITQEGYVLEGTLNHPIYVYDGKFMFKKLEELKIGDKVVINLINNLWGNVDVPEDIIWLCAFVMNNGIRVLDDKLYLKVYNSDDSQEIIQILKSVFYVNDIEYDEDNKLLIVKDRDLCKLLDDYDVKYVNSLDKRLPYWVFEGSKETVRKFIEFVFTKFEEDDDYLFALFPNEDMAIQFQCVVLNFGYITYRNDNIVFINECDFESILENLKVDRLYISEIADIKDSYNHVYDLEVSGSHSFVSNGFISHNTMLEVMGMYHTAIFYPDIEIAISAQTKENASRILEEKHREILRYYPLLSREIVSAKFSKDNAEIIFTSGGRIDTLANQQSSKGTRRRRLNIEESALLNNNLFKDVLEPIVNVPRRTIGKLATVNPEELNGQINFFTTAGFRGTDEYVRNLQMVDEMAELKGKLVIGAGWELPIHYGRGETKSSIMAKKDDPTMSPIYFAQNYESKWVGAIDSALVQINKILELRTLTKAELVGDKKHEYVLAYDVARSPSQSANKSVLVVLKIIRNSKGNIHQIHLVNMVVPPVGTSFLEQTILLKQMQKKYDAVGVVVDSNGLGMAIVDYALQENIDEYGNIYEPWATMNTEHTAIPGAPKLLYALNAIGKNTEIIINFLDVIERGMLRLLVSEREINPNYDKSVSEITPFVHTDLLVEELANLVLEKQPNNRLDVKRITKKVDKDRYSALAYGLYYIIKVYEANNNSSVRGDWLRYLIIE